MTVSLIQEGFAYVFDAEGQRKWPSFSLFVAVATCQHDRVSVRSPLEFGGLGWGSQNVEAPNPKLPTKWFLNVFFDEKHLKTIV